tara:strand:+ start:1784 stop:4369 length:2586 start_codon:yes stop_codon:yes gene_type:complete
MARKPKIDRFNEVVKSKFQIYNSLFLTLPFDSIKKTSLMLPLFKDYCDVGYKNGDNPETIVNTFFNKILPNYSIKKKNELMFHFIQYIERQVVLFDAIEDAGFSYVNNMHGRGTLRYINEEAVNSNSLDQLREYLNNFRVRIVLTAHPTQFYPDSVLGIINDLSKSINNGSLDTIKKLLNQLGRTRFYKSKKPSPYDEATSLIWYLENIFYYSAGNIVNYLNENVFKGKELDNSIFDFGFWPGGDRDGNPFVTTEITIKTAEKLKHSILRNYYRSLRSLRRKLTFDGVYERVQDLENKVYKSLLNNSNQGFTLEYMKSELDQIYKLIKDNYDSLYSDLVLDLIHKVKLFGFHFASLDLRQDSSIHSSVFNDIIKNSIVEKILKYDSKTYLELDHDLRCEILASISGDIEPEIFQNKITVETLKSIRVMKQIQKSNGEKGCNRYIISNCNSLESILQVFAMFMLSGWNKPKVDIIPLFETISDLKNSSKIIESLFLDKTYLAHLKLRGNKQTIMLGFSDGTKDGGYFMANWSIYKAKEELSKLATKYDISIAFFDGRGGPPSRGGGRTHEFYNSLGDVIQADDIQLTIQGQTISSNFGTLESSQFNLEQLLSSGIKNQIFVNSSNNLSNHDKNTLDILADYSYKAYEDFKSHPKFLKYLENITTLPYYSKTNIGSRPSKRGISKELTLKDLRAIPFVGSWSQSKQNVPGFFGVGTSLNKIKSNNDFERVKVLYKKSPFFRTLIANSMMSLTKSFFELTSYLSDDSDYGSFWNIIHDEYKLSKKMILELTGFDSLMENEQAGKASIEIRESIVQPLITIQQFALIQIQKHKKENHLESELLNVYEKMVTRSLFGNINASRNSA